MVTIPPHQKNNEIHQDLGGWFPDQIKACSYHNESNIDYHNDRLRAILILVKSLLELRNTSFDVLDFGVGDGKELAKLGLPLGEIIGIDISPHMISLAKNNFKGLKTQFLVGDVNVLHGIESESMDLVLSTNVLGYLTVEDEQKFFSESFRILRPGGFVLLTLGNELFDLFALNSGTANFFETHFGVFNTDKLLIEGNSSRFGNARRHNPLALEAKLSEVGFLKVKYSFSQWHTKPPILDQIEKNTGISEARLTARDHNLDANLLASTEQWKALFQCSIFGALFQKI